MRAKNERDQDFLDVLNDCADCAGMEVDTYSGRGMYGDECPSLTFESDAEMAAGLVRLGMKFEQYGYRRELPFMATDNLGRGTVIYWPRIILAQKDTA